MPRNDITNCCATYRMVCLYRPIVSMLNVGYFVRVIDTYVVCTKSTRSLNIFNCLLIDCWMDFFYSAHALEDFTNHITVHWVKQKAQPCIWTKWPTPLHGTDQWSLVYVASRLLENAQSLIFMKLVNYSFMSPSSWTHSHQLRLLRIPVCSGYTRGYANLICTFTTCCDSVINTFSALTL